MVLSLTDKARIFPKQRFEFYTEIAETCPNESLCRKFSSVSWQVAKMEIAVAQSN